MKIKKKIKNINVCQSAAICVDLIMLMMTNDLRCGRFLSSVIFVIIDNNEISLWGFFHVLHFFRMLFSSHLHGKLFSGVLVMNCLMSILIPNSETMII